MEKWIENKLGDVCELITDGKHGDCKNQENSGYYFLSAKDVYDGNLSYKNARQITEQDFLDTHRRTKLSPFDIVLTNSGSVGRMAIAKDIDLTHRTTFQKSVAILKPNHSVVYYKYLYYELLCLSPILIDIAVGSAQQNILLGDLRKFKVKLPPIPTQKRIAAILGAYDELIDVNNRCMQLLEETARETYKEWFIRMRFPGYNNTKKTKGVPEQVGEIKYFKDFIKLNRGFDLPEDKIINGNYPVIASSSIKAYHNQFKVKAPIITTGRSGSLGTVLFVNENGWPLNTSLFVKDYKGNDPYYVYYTLKQMDFESFNSGVGVPTLNQNHLHKLKLWIAGETLQRLFEQIVEPIFQQVENLKRQNTQLIQIRDRLLPRLISGKLKVRPEIHTSKKSFVC